ncbi:MarR family winged helix-turn-helix transcriptional regulator [Pseudonocardia phyllosphaerae]|uniref:MarR family winged helix-turn-helix transcriptional regulator n=1 Tax=Pseudonocardia phyllosphaerae TaxID=3390502 RepID=UPI00397B474E
MSQLTVKMGQGKIDSVSDSFSRVLWRAENLADQFIDASLSPLGLSSSLLGTLRMIIEEPGVSTAELARRANVRPQSIAYATGRLEHAGYIERHPHPVHGKIVGIHPTPRAEAALGDGETALAAAEERLLDGIAGRDRDTLVALLERVIANAQG